MIQKYQFKYEAISPISHGGEANFSNIQPFRTQKILFDGTFYDVPVLSGNGYRGGQMRRPAMKAFIDLLGIKKSSLGKRAYYLLFSGGSLSKGNDEVSIVDKLALRRTMPLVSIFGGGVKNMLLEGRMQVGFVYPVGKETREFTGVASDKSVFEFLDTVFYTHKDDYEGLEEGESPQMMYETEILVPGTEFVQQINVTTDDQIELSAFGFVVETWLKNPRLGSKENVGHGFVKVDLPEGLPSGKEFVQDTLNRKAEILDFLNSY